MDTHEKPDSKPFLFPDSFFIRRANRAPENKRAFNGARTNDHVSHGTFDFPKNTHEINLIFPGFENRAEKYEYNVVYIFVGRRRIAESCVWSSAHVRYVHSWPRLESLLILCSSAVSYLLSMLDWCFVLWEDLFLRFWVHVFIYGCSGEFISLGAWGVDHFLGASVRINVLGWVTKLSHCVVVLLYMNY